MILELTAYSTAQYCVAYPLMPVLCPIAKSITSLAWLAWLVLVMQTFALWFLLALLLARPAWFVATKTCPSVCVVLRRIGHRQSACPCSTHLKEKTMPFGVNIMRSQVLYWAAQGHSSAAPLVVWGFACLLVLALQLQSQKAIAGLCHIHPQQKLLRYFVRTNTCTAISSHSQFWH